MDKNVVFETSLKLGLHDIFVKNSIKLRPCKIRMIDPI